MVCVNSFDFALAIFFWTFLEFLIAAIILIKDFFGHSGILEPLSTSGLLSASPPNLTMVNTVEVIVKALLNSLKVTKGEVVVEEFVVFL
jgi:hypothetical protein